MDAVINHMCGAGNGAGTSSTCGSYYNANNREFSEVPYSAWDFNDNKCDREVNNYQDAHEVMKEIVMGIKNCLCFCKCTHIYEIPLNISLRYHWGERLLRQNFTKQKEKCPIFPLHYFVRID